MEEERRTGEQLPAEDAALVAQEQPVEEVAPVAEEQPAEEAAPVMEAPVAPLPEKTWSFGAAPKKESHLPGVFGFIGAFGCAFVLCMVLLALVLLLGDGRYEIVREILQERIVYVRQDDGTSGLLTPHEAADKGKQYAVSVVITTEMGSGIGSGFVYSADGYICTNYHVIEDAKTVQVVLADGTAYDATVKGYNAAADVAVLHINATGLTVAPLGKSADLLVGDEVVAIGTPAKLDYAGTATFGTVSATRRLLALGNSDGSVTKKMTVIQTDTQVNPGNSGGPLVDMYGKVVGVVVMKLTDLNGVTFEGMGFALPIDGVKEIADAIIAKGSFTGKNPIAEGRSLLGVTGHGGVEGLWYADDVTTGTTVPSSETAQPGYHYMATNGVYVMGLNGSNAAGKLQVGDIITRVDGLHVTSTTDLIAAANRHYAGESIPLTVLRNGSEMTVTVVLAEEPLA